MLDRWTASMWPNNKKNPSLVVCKNAKRYNNIVIAPEQFCKRRQKSKEKKKEECKEKVANRLDGDKVKVFKKRAYVINKLDSCEKDVRTLCSILDGLGYNSKLIENNVSYEKLKDQIDGKSRSTLVFFFGYWCKSSFVDDYIYLDYNVLSCRDFAKMFCFKCTSSIAIFTNCWYQKYSSSYNLPVTIPGDSCQVHHMSIIVNGVLRKSLFLTAVIDELEKFAKSEELQTLSFTDLRIGCHKYICRNENDNDDNQHIISFFFKGVIKDFVLTKQKTAPESLEKKIRRAIKRRALEKRSREKKLR